MKVFVGVDLGSTTSKAVVLDAQGEILGRGITNSRSNYDVAVDIARSEAFINARFNLMRATLEAEPSLSEVVERVTGRLATEFRIAQYTHQLDSLDAVLHQEAAGRSSAGMDLAAAVDEVMQQMRERVRRHFRFARPSSSFFRDLAASDYMELAQEVSTGRSLPFDALASLFDKAIQRVENSVLDLSFGSNIAGPFARVTERMADDLGPRVDVMQRLLQHAIDEPLEVAGNVGTGYGRARLPFAKTQIRSEILCHGLGAHRMFPKTRTVLDIGGQDTKAIQLDEQGIVTSFQMNDRCAAGCGRYLGYIADEMNLGLHELGPLADASQRPVKINSTCTVFAGAELRDRLAMGQKREDILAGLHRAIILRAMSLLARSGGVHDEFTFTGGVANNSAAVRALRQLTEENYGERVLNISPDSIFTGALGAATFAWRGSADQEAAA